MTIAGVLRWDLLGPIGCQAANKLESESSNPFNLTVFCKCCSHRSHVLKAEQSVSCGRARGLWTSRKGKQKQQALTCRLQIKLLAHKC